MRNDVLLPHRHHGCSHHNLGTPDHGLPSHHINRWLPCRGTNMMCCHCLGVINVSCALACQHDHHMALYNNLVV